ncbi:hypothetical protein EDB85DRAFT_1901102 [Lactarius pseudohatsudake]|nr:hypothetical protein EDB85DRAFT_1901102 [Lactarius pseudohatsudake]
MYIQNDYDTWYYRTHDCQSPTSHTSRARQRRARQGIMDGFLPRRGTLVTPETHLVPCCGPGPCGGELAGLILIYEVIMFVAVVQWQNASVLLLAREMGKSEQIPDSPPAQQLGGKGESQSSGGYLSLAVT